jgi:hypothetical protein
VTRTRSTRSTSPAPRIRPRGAAPFDRPELRTSWQRISGNLAVRIVVAVLVVAVTAALVYVAITR